MGRRRGRGSELGSGSGSERGRERGQREDFRRERERICLAAEEMVRVSEFLPFILAFLGDDFVKIVGLFCKNRRPRASWPTIFDVVALFF